MCHLRCSLEFDLTFNFKCNVRSSRGGAGVYVSIVLLLLLFNIWSSLLEQQILKAIVEILITRFATNNGALSVLSLCRSTSFLPGLKASLTFLIFSFVQSLHRVFQQVLDRNLAKKYLSRKAKIFVKFCLHSS